MNEKEKYYREKYGDELLLNEACAIWRKPGYSTLCKKLPKIGYAKAAELGIIPKYHKEGNAYLFYLIDVLEFCDLRRK